MNLINIFNQTASRSFSLSQELDLVILVIKTYDRIRVLNQRTGG